MDMIEKMNCRLFFSKAVNDELLVSDATNAKLCLDTNSVEVEEKLTDDVSKNTRHLISVYYEKEYYNLLTDDEILPGKIFKIKEDENFYKLQTLVLKNKLEDEINNGSTKKKIKL